MPALLHRGLAAQARRERIFRRRAAGELSCLLALLLLSCAAVVQAADRPPLEDERIEYLLAIVSGLHDAQFIRNGKAYDSAAAVDHLRAKLRWAGSQVKTAEDFIRLCASESSVSGKPYEIRLANGQQLLAADFLRQQLAQFDKRLTESGGRH
jgi:Family of unknown function (DUF5329)